MNLTHYLRRFVIVLFMLATLFEVPSTMALAAPPVFSNVRPDRPLTLPADFALLDEIEEEDIPIEHARGRRPERRRATTPPGTPRRAPRYGEDFDEEEI